MGPAIRESVASFALINNQDPTPSQQDFAINHRLNKTGKVVEIYMIDQIIIEDNDFFSFAGEGLL